MKLNRVPFHFAGFVSLCRLGFVCGCRNFKSDYLGFHGFEYEIDFVIHSGLPYVFRVFAIGGIYVG